MHALIIAGGSGKRFWPMSRTKNPKQFLNLFGETSMIQMTYERLTPLVKPENILVITNKEQKALAAQHLPELPDGNIVGEPLSRNTAPCIGLGAMLAALKNPDEVQIVLPADHLIQDVDEFRRILKLGVGLAIEKECLITIGINPTRPETGYGYIQTNPQATPNVLSEKYSNQGVQKVKTFAEKPNLETAKRFLESGDFLWNSGIFIWKTKSILQALDEFVPDLYDSLMNIKNETGKPGFSKALLTAYRQIKSISIDYAVMEKSDNVFVLKGDFGWSDVGNWEEFYKVNSKDKDGNIILGSGVLRDSSNNLIISDKPFVAGIGLKDMVIVQSNNVLLVCPRDRSQDVKEIVDYLSRQDMNKIL